MSTSILDHILSGAPKGGRAFRSIASVGEDGPQQAHEPSALSPRHAASSLPQIDSNDDSLRYLKSGLAFDRTRPNYNSANRFADDLLGSAKNSKPLQQIRNFSDEWTASNHLWAETSHGFLHRQHSVQAETLYKIFERVVPAYNTLAKQRDVPEYRGRLFLVDSSECNAYVPVMHDDVYAMSGLIRQLAHWCERKNVPFSEDIVAALYAHELAHVLQGTGFKGSAELYSHAGIFGPEATAIIREAEKDADRVAIDMLTIAGYSPEQILQLLRFLNDITEESTFESLSKDHPHPEERLAELETYLATEGCITPIWEKPLSLLDAKSFAQLPSARHCIEIEKEVHTLSQLQGIAQRSTSAPAVVEIAKVYKERERQVQAKALLGTPIGQELAAHKNLADNILLFANTLLDVVAGTPSTCLPRCRVGALIDLSVTAEEVSSLGNSVALSDKVFRRGGTIAKESIEAALRKDLRAAVKQTLECDIPLEQQTFIVNAINEIWDSFSSGKFVPAFSVTTDEVQQNSSIEEIAQRYRSGDTAVLQALCKHPYSAIKRCAVDAHEDREIRLSQDGRQLGTLRRLSRETDLFPIFGAEQERKMSQQSAYHQVFFDWVYSYSDSLVADFKINQAIRDHFVATLKENDQHVGDNEQFSAFRKSMDWAMEEPVRMLSSEHRTPEALQYLLRHGLLTRPYSFRARTFETEHGLEVLSIKGVEDELLEDFFAETAPEFLDSSQGLSLSYEKLAHLEKTAKELKGQSFQESAKQHLVAVLGSFRVEERRKLIESLRFYLKPERGREWHLEPTTFFDIAEECLGKETAIEIMTDYLGSKDYLGELSEECDLETLQRTVALYETVINAHQSFESVLPDVLAFRYLRAKIAFHSSKGDTPSEYVGDTLINLSQHFAIEIYAKSEDENLAPSNKYSFFYPAGLSFSRSGQKSFPLYAKREHEFFAAFFEIGLDDLQTIARNQRQLLEQASNSVRNLLDKAEDEAVENPQFLELLNLNIAIRLLEEVSPSGSDPKDALIALLSVKEEEANKVGSFAQLGTLAVTRLPTHEQRTNYLERLNNGFVPASQSAFAFGSSTWKINNCSDNLVGELITADSTRVREMLTLFRRLLCNVGLPKITLPTISKLNDTKSLRKIIQRASYTEAMLESSEIAGKRGTIVMEELRKNRDLLLPPSQQQGAVETLQNMFPAPNILRDAWIRVWAMQLVPELFTGCLAKTQDFPGKDATQTNEFLKRCVGDEFVAWRNIERIDPKSWSSVRRLQVLSDLQQIVPLLMNHESRLLLGELAVRIREAEGFGSSLPKALDAIELYLPDATPARDRVLNRVSSYCEIGGSEESARDLRRLRRLYCSEQKLRYQKETTRLQVVSQAFASVQSVLAAEDKVAMLLWMIDPKHHAMPASLKELDNRGNIDFSHLPEHARVLPEWLRREVLKPLLLGENGVLKHAGASQHKSREQFLAGTLEYLFPTAGHDPRAAGISNEGLAIVKDVCLAALNVYPEGILCEICFDLMKLSANRETLSFGERLLGVSKCFGSVGKKLCQLLSEREDLVPDKNLRRVLGRARSEVEPLPLLTVVDTAIAAGWSLDEIVIGAPIARASMKDVRAGRVLEAGVWQEAALKTLIPNVLRRNAFDVKALAAGTAILHAKYGIDYGDIHRQIDSMLAEESNLEQEVVNSDKLMQTFAAVKTAVPIVILHPFQREGRNCRFFLAEPRALGIQVALVVEGYTGAGTTAINETLAACRRGMGSQLIRAGTAHADPHLYNVFVDFSGSSRPKSLTIIDTGLVVSLDAKHAEAARKIKHGILLSDAELLTKGISEFLNISPQQSAEISQQAVRGTYRRRIESLTLGLLKIEAADSEKQLLSRWLKGCNQSLSQYPLALPYLPATFRDVANELQLTSFSKKARLAFFSAIDVISANWRHYGGARLVSAVTDGVKSTVEKASAAIRQVRELPQLLAQRQHLEQLLGGLRSAVQSESANVRRDISQQVVSDYKAPAFYLKIAAKDPVLQEQLRQLVGNTSHPALTERFVELLTIASVFASRAPFLESETPGQNSLYLPKLVSNEELKLLLKIEGYQFTEKDSEGSSFVRDVILARAFACAWLAQEFPDDDTGSFNFRNPVLRKVAEEIRQLSICLADFQAIPGRTNDLEFVNQKTATRNAVAAAQLRPPSSFSFELVLPKDDAQRWSAHEGNPAYFSAAIKALQAHPNREKIFEANALHNFWVGLVDKQPLGMLIHRKMFDLGGRLSIVLATLDGSVLYKAELTDKQLGQLSRGEDPSLQFEPLSL